MTPAKLEEVAAIVVATPGIAEGFIQHYAGMHKNPKAVRNPGGGFQSSHHPEVHFRVVLWGEDRTFDVSAGKVKGKLVEVQKRTLKEALTVAFEQLEIQFPPELFFDAES